MKDTADTRTTVRDTVDAGLKEIEQRRAVAKVTPLETKASSLDFLRAVYLNDELPLSVRMRAARDCLPFEVPKLAVAATLKPTEGIAERLEAAIRRSLQSGATVIDGEAIEVPQGPPVRLPVAPTKGPGFRRRI
jgi:hypothetical protein